MNAKQVLILSLAINVAAGLAYVHRPTIATAADTQKDAEAEAQKDVECTQRVERWIGARRISDKKLICVRISPNCIVE
jgi:hypothetical protein